MKRKIRIIHESHPQVGPAEVERRLLTLDVDSETTVGEIVAWADGIYRTKRGGYNLTVAVNLPQPDEGGEDHGE